MSRKISTGDEPLKKWPRRRPFEKREVQETPPPEPAAIAEKKDFEIDIEAVLRLINRAGVTHDIVGELSPSSSPASSPSVSGLADSAACTSPSQSLPQSQQYHPLSNRILYYLRRIVVSVLHSVSAGKQEDIPSIAAGEFLTVATYRRLTDYFSCIWRGAGKASYFAFEGLLLLLELSLLHSQDNYALFHVMMDFLGPENGVLFLCEAVAYIIESDMHNQTDYMDSLLLYLSIFNVKSNGIGRALQAAFATSMPEFAGFYLCSHEKQFDELYTFVRLSEIKLYDPTARTITVNLFPHYFTYLHAPERRVIVSNAPPVKLRRRGLRAKQKFECEAAAGGLVSGIKPSLDRHDIWVSYFDTEIVGPQAVVLDVIKSGVVGKLRRTTAFPVSSLVDAPKAKKVTTKADGFLWEKAEHEIVVLQKMLESFANDNFTVNPLILLKDDHKAFYNGISNGLLWPAFHGLNDYIIDDYRGADGAANLAADWAQYIRVNHHFAIYTGRTARRQDFLWIQDYHLFFVGLILRSLEPELTTGFFLHIPFGLNDAFMEQYREQGIAIVRGLLAFNRVGFQTRRDCDTFVKYVGLLFPKASIKLLSSKTDTVYRVQYHSHCTHIGAFPISIKSKMLAEVSADEKTLTAVPKLREKIMAGRTGKLFVSVERFDYTKGIEERLRAFQVYFRENPERAKQDVFYQIAAGSRAEVSAYKAYQERCIELLEEINAEFAFCFDAAQPMPAVENATVADGGEIADAEMPPPSPLPRIPPVYFDTDNHPHEDVVRYFLAADIVVVTPVLDGMNLVAKEVPVCNPNALLILSEGAGAQIQFTNSGLGGCYLRVDDIKDAKAFAAVLKTAAMETNADDVRRNGEKLAEFIFKNDVDHWLKSYYDVGWTHDVIKRKKLVTLENFISLMEDVRNARRRVVDAILEDRPVPQSMLASFNNALASLEENLSPHDSFTRKFKTVDEHSPDEFHAWSHSIVDIDVRAESDMALNGEQLLAPDSFISQCDAQSSTSLSRSSTVSASDREEQGAAARALNSLSIDIKDELVSLKQDIYFLQFVNSRSENIEDFIHRLAQFYAQGEVAFFDDVKRVREFLAGVCGTAKQRIQALITDWDGTMKNYTCCYSTSMQPAYSGVIIARFCARYTNFAAVLTAGPLRDVGILDLTSIPDEGYITFGGSSGLEWLLDGARVVDDAIYASCVDAGDALVRVGDKISDAFFSKQSPADGTSDEFRQFLHIGSGFQRKVDRITLGVQNVVRSVPGSVRQRYVDALTTIVKEVDPTGELFTLHETELELDVILKKRRTGGASCNDPSASSSTISSSGSSTSQNGAAAEKHKKTFDKSDGVEFLLSRVKVSIDVGTVLICGDTLSDLPMVEYAYARNPRGTFAIFVQPTETVRAALRNTLPESRLCFVESPSVIHAAMARLVVEPFSIAFRATAV